MPLIRNFITNLDPVKGINVFLFVAILAVLVFLRLYGLGRWDLAVDEYYLSKSIISIAENGLPSFPGGGYYIRGLLQQYLSVPVYILTESIEWSVRILPAICNILAFPAVYLIGLKLKGPMVAFVCLLLFGLSLWEIEFARYGRMYAPFQALFLWQVYLAIKYIDSENEKLLMGIFSISFVSVFVYEGAIFSILLAFLVLLIRKPDTAVYYRYLFIALLTAIAFLLINFIDFRQAASTAAIGIEESGKSIPIYFPTLLISNISFTLVNIFLLLLGLIVTAWLIILHLKKNPDVYRDPMQIILSSLYVLGLLTNQFLLSIMILSSVLLLDFSRHNYRKFISFLFSPILLLTWIWLLVWSTTSINSTDISFDEFVDASKSTPQLFTAVIWPWLRSMPFHAITLFASFIGLSVYLIVFDIASENQKLQIVVALTILLFAATSTINSLYSSTRYTFYLYPLLLIFFSICVYDVCRVIRETRVFYMAFISILGAFILFSETYDLQHLMNVSSKTYNYRIPYDSGRKELYYSRRDFRSPAEFINQNARPGDTIITSVKVTDYYLDNVTYTYLDQKNLRGVLGCGGDCYIWNKTPIVYKLDKISELINSSQQDLWILSQSSRNRYRPDIASFLDNNYSKNKVYTNLDDSVDVFRF
jgi:hypothetical protein